MRKLLVANRGEIARRIFRTARSMGISTVAVFSDPDADLPHVREADEAVRLPGATPAETYLDVAAVLGAAARTGADAVHPGYGFLSENAGFARACLDAGLTFVGPSPEAIEAMGSKVAAKELMAAAGVPVLGSEGFPLLVKAAFGGGGRGMRIVRDAAELDEAMAAAGREAAAAFGDGTVFVERYVEQPRHVEVQILGDAHGNLIHLFERECSIQRRYQKIVEESPSPGIGPELRQALCGAAVAAGRALGYVGAGTVEFIVAPSGEFSFLEVNTRLQVEHPVTEMVTGLDLVELQLRIATGEPLAVVPEVRGHAVEVRLYAEDVPAGFVPASGRIDRFHVPSAEGVRVDAGYEDGSTVSTFYDAMLAKVIAHGDTREHAIGRLLAVLHGTAVHGVPTNRRLLLSVLAHPEFAEGRTDTGFLERHDPARLGAEPFAPEHAVAAALAGQAARRAAAPVQPLVPSGWRNVPSGLQRARFRVGEREVEVGYLLGRPGPVVEVDGERLPEVRIWAATPGSVDLGVGGVRRQFTVQQRGSLVHVDGLGASVVLEAVELLPEPEAGAAAGSLHAPMPGQVRRVLVAVGDRVERGQALAVLEAMKMEHTMASAAGGTVTAVLVAPGQQVETGQVLVVVEPDDGGAGDG